MAHQRDAPPIADRIGGASLSGGVGKIPGTIGKTSLVRAFAHTRPDRVRVLIGACDDLVTPRTLGPLRDAMRGEGGPLAAALAAGDREAVLTTLLAELGNATRPTVLVLEDVHWADDATLDVLRYLGRRVDDHPLVVVVTYRDEEVGPSLQRVLGALGGPAVRRLAPARAPARRSRGWWLHDPHVCSALPAHRGQPVLRLGDGGRRGLR